MPDYPSEGKIALLSGWAGQGVGLSPLSEYVEERCGLDAHHCFDFRQPREVQCYKCGEGDNSWLRTGFGKCSLG